MVAWVDVGWSPSTIIKPLSPIPLDPEHLSPNRPAMLVASTPSKGFVRTMPCPWLEGHGDCANVVARPYLFQVLRGLGAKMSLHCRTSTSCLCN